MPWRRRARRVLLVHAVEHRQADGLGVDQLHIRAARLQAGHDEVRQADAHAIGAIGAVEDENAVSHGSFLTMREHSIERTGRSRLPAAIMRGYMRSVRSTPAAGVISADDEIGVYVPAEQAG